MSSSPSPPWSQASWLIGWTNWFDAPMSTRASNHFPTTSMSTHIIPLALCSFFWMELRIHNKPNHVPSFSSSSLTNVASLALLGHSHAIRKLLRKKHFNGPLSFLPCLLDPTLSLLKDFDLLPSVSWGPLSPPLLPLTFSLELDLVDQNPTNDLAVAMAFVSSWTPWRCNSCFVHELE